MAPLLTLFTGIPKPNVPGPPPSPAIPEKTPGEKEAEELNLKLLRQNVAESEASRGALEKAFGKPFAEIQAGQAQQQAGLSQLLNERYLRAIKGELPVSPTLTRSLQEQRGTLEEGLRRQLGPGYAISSPGIQALAEFGKRSTELEEQARRGEITAAEQFGFAQPGVVLSTLGLPQFSPGLRGNPPQIGSLMQGGQFQRDLGFRSNLAGFGGALETNLLTGRLNAARDIANAELAMAMMQGMSGAATGAMGAAAMSSARLKKDILPLDPDEYDRALMRLLDTPVVRYRYKWEPDDRTPHIGPIAELSPEEIRDGPLMIRLLDYSGLEHAAIKALNRKVDRLLDHTPPPLSPAAALLMR